MTDIEYTPGPLLDAARNTPTALWNDSSDLDELRQSISYGGVGATCNPGIAYTPIKKHPVERGLRAYCLKLTASQLLRGALFTVCFFECRIIQPLNHGVDLFLGSAAVEGVIAF